MIQEDCPNLVFVFHNCKFSSKQIGTDIIEYSSCEVVTVEQEFREYTVQTGQSERERTMDRVTLSCLMANANFAPFALFCNHATTRLLSSRFPHSFGLSILPLPTSHNL